MAISLKKGERVSIDKSMRMALVGLGWDPNQYDSGYDFDLDASAFILDHSGKVRRDEDFVFYNNPDWNNHTIWSTGDDTSGGNSDDGDDETIFIDFSKIPDYVDRIAVTVTIHDAEERKQNFGQVRNAYVRVAKVSSEYDTVGEEVIRFDLEEDFSIETALVVCEIYRKNGEWKFNAVAAGYQGGLETLCRHFGVNV